jgi:multidrug efflux pump subunit AcrA (membrane-fusion protein)
LAAAGVLLAVSLFFVLSPSESDPAAAEMARQSRARASKEAEARRQLKQDLLERERAQALAEAEARLEDIRRKQEELARTAAQPGQIPAEQDKRKAEEKQLASDKARIEQDLREATQLAKKTERPAPKPPSQEEKPQPSPAVPADQLQATTQSALAKVDEVSGEAFLVTKEGKSPATVGANLLPGQGLETGGGTSRLVLRFPDKTRVDLGPETLLADIKADSGKRLALTQGTVRAVVAKQPKGEPLIFTTPHGEAKVVGTTLRLYVDPDPKKGTRLEVEEGKVELKNLAKKTAYVESGHYAVAAAGVELVSRKLESIPAPGPAWILDFQDDFTMAKPDRSLWGVNRGIYSMGSSPGSPEKQIYVDKAVECKGGSAVIHADRKGAAADSEWTSGYLGMNKTHARLYGRFEVCCKLPRGKGLQSWFCLVPDYPDPPCIALLTCSGDSPTSGVGMVRWDGTELGRKFVPVGGVDFSDGFHVVACEWESGSVKWYVDGELKESVSENVPQKPLALMITLTVGAWAGLPDASTPSSATLEIKYVRVFKKK